LLDVSVFVPMFCRMESRVHPLVVEFRFRLNRTSDPESCCNLSSYPMAVIMANPIQKAARIKTFVHMYRELAQYILLMNASLLIVEFQSEPTVEHARYSLCESYPGPKDTYCDATHGKICSDISFDMMEL